MGGHGLQAARLHRPFDSHSHLRTDWISAKNSIRLPFESDCVSEVSAHAHLGQAPSLDGAGSHKTCRACHLSTIVLHIHTSSFPPRDTAAEDAQIRLRVLSQAVAPFACLVIKIRQSRVTGHLTITLHLGKPSV